MAIVSFILGITGFILEILSFLIFTDVIQIPWAMGILVQIILPIIAALHLVPGLVIGWRIKVKNLMVKAGIALGIAGIILLFINVILLLTVPQG
jgi:hypothetical protein